MRALFAVLLALLASPALAGPAPDRPDPELTPGAINSAVTQANLATTICRPGGYTKSVRHTSAALKRAIYAEYDIDKAKIHAEVDHRVPLTVGGADVKANLWIQDYDSHPWNAHLKDHLEVFAWRAVCNHRMTLRDAQTIFLGDWIAGYQKYLGTPP